MDERKSLYATTHGIPISKAPNRFVQRSCSFPTIRPCAIPKQLTIYVPCHTRRELILPALPALHPSIPFHADQLHRTNDPTVTRKQQSLRYG